MVPANLAQLEHIIRNYKTCTKNKLNNNNNYLTEKRAVPYYITVRAALEYIKHIYMTYKTFKTN